MAEFEQQTLDTPEPSTQTPEPSQYSEAPESVDHAQQGGEDQGSDSEARARAMGWVPRDEYRGPAENWRDADEFIRRGEEELPVLRERNRTMADKLTQIENRVQQQERQFQQRLESLDRMHAMSLQRQREQIIGSYEAAKRQAVELGDMDRYDQLNRDQWQAVGQFDQQTQEVYQPPRQEQQQQGGMSPADQQVYQEFVSQNQWFESDPVLNLAMQEAHVRLLQEAPGMSFRENLQRATQEVRQRYPAKFGIQRSAMNGGPAVEGGGRVAGAGAPRKGSASLPPEAMAQAKKDVADGLYKNIEEWAAFYHSID